MNAYGMAKWPTRLARIPLPHESTIIARCQSMRTVHGRAAEPWSYSESVAYLNNVERVRKHRVTVPSPLCQSPPVRCSNPPPRASEATGSPCRPTLTHPCELDQPKQRGAVSFKEVEA